MVDSVTAMLKNKMRKFFIFFITILLRVEIGCGQKTRLSNSSNQPKPVFLIHGIFASSILAYLVTRIKKYDPLRVIHNTDVYSGRDSFIPLQQQISGALGQEFRNFSDSHPGGFHLIGYSQGAILGRALIQDYLQHNVHHFISIAAPLAGQYGFTLTPRQMARTKLSPELALGSSFFYNPLTQRTLSLANYWHDPFQPGLHLRSNTFLPYYDNLIQSKKSKTYKAAFVKLKKLVTIQGPEDRIIVPWQSGDFSYFNQFGEMVNYTQRDIYTQDLFGLRTLDETGRFVKYTQRHVGHLEWVFNDEVIDNYILPNLN